VADLIDYIRPEHVAMLEQAATSQRDRLIIRLLFYLGCKVSELLGLTTEDIDLANCKIRIRYLKHHTSRHCPYCHSLLVAKLVHCSVCAKKVTKAEKESIAIQRQRILPVDSETMNRIQAYTSTAKLKSIGGQQLLFSIK